MLYQAEIERILAAALDRCETCEEEPNPEYARGALEVAGVALGIIAMQATGEGIGVMDALEASGDFLEKIDGGRFNDINIKACAEKFIAEVNNSLSVANVSVLR